MKLDGDDYFPTKEEIHSSWEGGAPMKWQSDTKKKPSIRQTILVAALVSLIIGALTTFTAFTVTSRQTSSPVVASTDPLENGLPRIPKEYVKEMLASFHHKGPPPSNSTHHLGKRQAAVGVPHKCIAGDKFIKRHCVITSTGGWEDVCTHGSTQYTVQGSCATGELCSNHLDGRPWPYPVVICRPTEDLVKITNKITDKITKGDHKAGQYGVRTIPAQSSSKPVWRHYKQQIKVQIDMGAGSISAYLLATDSGNSIWDYNSKLVGRIKGIDFDYCNFAIDGVGCVPTATQDLKTYLTVDFEFNVQTPESVTFVYFFWGWHG